MVTTTPTRTLRDLREALVSTPPELLAIPQHWTTTRFDGTACYCPVVTIALRWGLVTVDEIVAALHPPLEDSRDAIEDLVVPRVQAALSLSEPTAINLVIEEYDDGMRQSLTRSFGHVQPDARAIGLSQAIAYLDALLEGEGL